MLEAHEHENVFVACKRLFGEFITPAFDLLVRFLLASTKKHGRWTVRTPPNLVILLALYVA